MKAIDIIIILSCLALGIYIVISTIMNKKKGKASCGCDCSNCDKCAKQKCK